MKRTSVLTTILIGAASIGIVTSLVLGISSYFVVKNITDKNIRESTASYAEIAASMIDPDVFECVTEETGYDENYYKIHDILSNFYLDDSIEFIYTFRMTESGNMVFVVDTDTDEPGELGEIYDDIEPEAIEGYIKGLTVIPTAPYSDEWGEFYSGYAPIKNASGKTIGLVGVDCSTETVKNELASLATSIVIISVLCIICAVIGGWLLSKMFRPLIKVAQDAGRAADGDLDVRFDYYTANDEIGAVCRTIERNNMIMKEYITDISMRLESLASGNFNAVSSVEYVGDYASIKTDLDKISESLGKFFGGVSSISGAVHGGAAQVSSGAQALSQGTAQQASSIEELAATIQEITDQITANAKAAKNAMDKTNEAGSEMRYAAEKMNELVTAMSETKECSDQIGKIIKSIEDIAFQTNILALNASVEAARAGEAGKGFAVVADEVRELAGKSAEAAANTNTLIENTIKSVDNGNALVSQVAEVMERVSSAAATVAELNTKIHTSTDNLVNSVAQINTGIDQISGVVQTTSATAQQSAATSQELTGQAAALEQLVGEFVLK